MHRAYPNEVSHQDAFARLVASVGGEADVAGHSIEQRPIVRYTLGPRGAPVVLLTALIHAVEYIGSLALLGVLRAVAAGAGDDARAVRDGARLVLLPVLNPDGFAHVQRRLARAWPTGRRCNARGVDLNRNFEPVAGARSWHPAAGSRFALSPYYSGAAPFSEPETRAVRESVARERPGLSIAFHSFGALLLYPYSYTRRAHPARARYEALGRAFTGAQPARPYTVKPAIGLYPVVGGLDDWLSVSTGALAFTLEVGRLDARLLDPRRLLNPFDWANPRTPDATLAHVVPAVLALLAAWLREATHPQG